MNRRKYFRLLLLTDGSSQQREFKFNNLRIFTLIFCVVLLVGGITYSTSRILANYYTQIAMTDVMDENAELRQNLGWIEDRVNEVTEDLYSLTESDDQLRIMADMPLIDDDIRQVGVGGAVGPEISAGVENERARDLIFDLEKIEREIRLQKASFVEIERQFAERAELIRHTPSIYPTEGGRFSSMFGRRPDPFNGRITQHNGIDISVERGTPVYATADGVVVHAKRVHGLGKLIVIDHGYGFKTAYGHLDRIISAKGRTVSRGDKIGEVGNTGRSTAPHLHYEVHVDRKAVDPRDYFFEGYAAIP